MESFSQGSDGRVHFLSDSIVASTSASPVISSKQGQG